MTCCICPSLLSPLLCLQALDLHTPSRQYQDGTSHDVPAWLPSLLQEALLRHCLWPHDMDKKEMGEEGSEQVTRRSMQSQECPLPNLTDCANPTSRQCHIPTC